MLEFDRKTRECGFVCVLRVAASVCLGNLAFCRCQDSNTDSAAALPAPAASGDTPADASNDTADAAADVATDVATAAPADAP